MRFNENDLHDPSRLDFLPRAQRQHFTRMIAVFALCLLVQLLLAVLPGLEGTGFEPLLSLFTIVFIAFYALIHKQRDLDHITNTEYQNMLYAQGLSTGAFFYLFVRRDGTILYTGGALREVFPAIRTTDISQLEDLLARGGVKTTDRERLLKTVGDCTTERMALNVHTGTGEPEQFILNIDPLARPGGVVLLRGREYRESRSGTQLMPDALRSTRGDKLDHMLAHSPTAQYTSDQYGRIEFANPAMEQLLGYEPGMLTASKLTLAMLLQSINGEPPAHELGLVEYAGDATLRRANGSGLRAMLFQCLMRDEQGKAVAATGTILPFQATS